MICKLVETGGRKGKKREKDTKKEKERATERKRGGREREWSLMEIDKGEREKYERERKKCV